MNHNEIIERALAQPPEAIRRSLTMAIRSADPDLHVVEAQDLYDTLYRFADKGHCTLRSVGGFDADVLTWASQGRVHGEPHVAWWEVEWQRSSFEIVEVQLSDGFHRQGYVVACGKDREALSRFLVALDRFGSEVEGAVLVFQDGCWSYDEDLYRDIQMSTFDNIVLPGGMAEQIRGDVEQWLDSRSLYERHGVPWKRGMILVGPPGNGKTHMIKALANAFSLSALYVRGFKAEYSSDSHNISSVFEKARKCAPSMLILEDLDTLVDPGNRSHFLNELDGFALNEGILAVASANDPARLDPALVNRPSRFDRRYFFGLPGIEERRRYLQFFTATLDVDLRLGDRDAKDLARETEAFSYAYLKELVLSSMMSWISEGRREAFVKVMNKNVGPLSEQMKVDPMPTPEAPADSEDDPYKRQMRAMRKHMRG